MNKNIDYLKERFKDCFDVKFRELSTILGNGIVVFIDDLCNSQWMMEYMILPLRGLENLREKKKVLVLQKI